MDRHVLVLAGDRERDLPFEIEMLLAADTHRALHPARSRSKRGLDIAALELQRLADEGRLGAASLIEGDHGRKILVGDPGGEASAPRGSARLADDDEDRLTVVGDEICREQWLVMPARRAHVIRPWNISGGQHGDDARRSPNRIELE